MAVLYNKLQTGNKLSGVVNREQPNYIKESMRRQTAQANGDFNNKVKAINYNQEFPMKTAEGNDFFLTRATEFTKNTPGFIEFTPGIAAYTDSTMIPNVGNYRGVTIDENTGSQHFLSNMEGDTSLVKKAIFGQLSNKDLGFK